MGNGHEGEAQHGHPALPSRRDDPFRRQPGASPQQRPLRVGPDRLVGTGHRLADPEPLEAMLEAVENGGL
jgi:hypothetical protein